MLGIGAAEPSLSRTIYLIVAGALNGAMSCRNLLTQSRAFAGFPPDALANQWVPRWSFHCDLPPNRTYSTGSVAPEEVEMRIFIAGASGVLGRALTPVLISRGHTICGMFKDSSIIFRCVLNPWGRRRPSLTRSTWRPSTTASCSYPGGDTISRTKGYRGIRPEGHCAAIFGLIRTGNAHCEQGGIRRIS